MLKNFLVLIGVAVIFAGIGLFADRQRQMQTDSGENKIRLGKVEFSFSDPTLVIILIGFSLVVIGVAIGSEQVSLFLRGYFHIPQEQTAKEKKEEKKDVPPPALQMASKPLKLSPSEKETKKDSSVSNTPPEHDVAEKKGEKDVSVPALPVPSMPPKSSPHKLEPEKPLSTISAALTGMVKIPGGTYLASLGENNQHHEKVGTFYIDKYLVTQTEYEQAMGNNPSYFEGCPKCPVERVTWSEADAYCKKAGKRLPTEWEWEKAAKGGSETKYAWGDSKDMAGDYAWYHKNSGGKTHPVGVEKKPNGYGLYDMAGNVWEWTATKKGNGSFVLRGGSWDDYVSNTRPANSNIGDPDKRLNVVGFRCSQMELAKLEQEKPVAVVEKNKSINDLKTAIVVFQENVSGESVPFASATRAITDHFVQEGLQITAINPGDLYKNKEWQAKPDQPGLTNTIAQSTGSEIIALGQGTATSQNIVSDIYTAMVTLHINVVNSRSGQVLISMTEKSNGSGLSPETALEQAFEKAGKQIAPKLIRALAEKWVAK